MRETLSPHCSELCCKEILIIIRNVGIYANTWKKLNQSYGRHDSIFNTRVNFVP